MENVESTHECGKNPLSERSGDLLVAYRCLLSVHVEVKLLCFASQEALHTNKEEGAQVSSDVSSFLKDSNWSPRPN